MAILPDHIRGFIDDLDNTEISPAVIKIVEDVCLKHWGWGDDDLALDPEIEIGGEG